MAIRIFNIEDEENNFKFKLMKLFCERFAMLYNSNEDNECWFTYQDMRDGGIQMLFQRKTKNGDYLNLSISLYEDLIIIFEYNQDELYKNWFEIVFLIIKGFNQKNKTNITMISF